MKNMEASDRKRDLFYDVVKDRVAAALKRKGIDPVENRGASLGRSIHYSVVIAAWLLSGVSHVKVRASSVLFRSILVTFPRPNQIVDSRLQGSLLGSFLLAICGWLMGALGHDAGHFAASRTAWVNDVGVWAMSLICNPIVWQHQHTYAHHSYTNEFDKDPDLHHFDQLLRVHKKIRHRTIHTYQTNRIWVAVAYAFVCFGTCFWIPWSVLTSGTLHSIVDWQDSNRPSRAIGLKLHWYSYIFFVVFLPFFIHESVWTALLSVYIHMGTIGVVFAIFSQINHLNEVSVASDMESRSSASRQRDPVIKDSWAAAQVETSNNFASGSLLWHVLSNGLNLQIEHHLFPGLNHGHLHHIAPVVRDTCKEFGVVYKSYNTWSDLMSATLDWYEKLSINERSTKVPGSGHK